MNETEQIEIVVNGKPSRVSAGLSITGLLRELRLDETRVAVELDRSIVRRPEWVATEVKSGSRLEIVQFVGGG
ncbi:MAG TPA: sulfur carrier protein ThiS [Bryobacteraceae bacterium]|jgi:sulfur carrier protein|nr:sulfur carrier protein ThiS [Bryobacteraceae bacterium]